MMSSFRTQKTQPVVLILKNFKNHKFVRKTTSKKMINKILKINQRDQCQRPLLILGDSMSIKDNHT